MNTSNKMTVIQSNNEYRIYTPQKRVIAHIVMPPDGQYIQDGKVIEIMCKALSNRWGINKK